MHDLIIIGAGPGGIALAAEAFASGIDPSQILILEKGPTHNSAIRQLYPEKKLTTANYKGFAARCEGLLCVRDMTKPETLQFFDQIISDYQINIHFNAEVFGMGRPEEPKNSQRRKLVDTTSTDEELRFSAPVRRRCAGRRPPGTRR